MTLVLDVAIVGAGLAGCSAARRLRAQGRRIAIFDRGRRAGGRASSNQLGYDYGVPAFIADAPLFVERVYQWREAGLVKQWLPRARHWVGTEQRVDELPTVEVPMQWIATASFADVFAAELEQMSCQHESVIQNLAFQNGHWLLSNAAGEQVGRAAQLLLAMPIEQARRLMCAPLQHALLPVERPSMPMSVPQWVAMLEFEEPVSTTTDLILFDEHPALAAAWSEARKPAGDATRWIIHSKPVWAQTRLSTERQSIAEEMYAIFKQAIGNCPLVMSHRAHRWTFARCRDPIGKGPLQNRQPPITLCGDWAFDGNLQGAWLSGREAADLLALPR